MEDDWRADLQKALEAETAYAPHPFDSDLPPPDPFALDANGEYVNKCYYRPARPCRRCGKQVRYRIGRSCVVCQSIRSASQWRASVAARVARTGTCARTPPKPKTLSAAVAGSLEKVRRRGGLMDPVARLYQEWKNPPKARAARPKEYTEGEGYSEWARGGPKVKDRG